MKRKIYIVFFILISIATPLFSTPWDLILDRQVSTNRYGYEFNGQQGIQDEELVPDTNGNKVVDEAEVEGVITFIFAKSSTIMQIDNLQSFMRTSGIKSQINFISEINAIRKSQIRRLRDLLLDYQRIERQEASDQRQLDYLGHKIALNGYQAALSVGKLYLSDGSFVEGKLVRIPDVSDPVDAKLEWGLTADHRIDLPIGHYFLRSGDNIVFKYLNNEIDFVRVIDQNFLFNNEGRQIGNIYKPKITIDSIGVELSEPHNMELSGNLFENVSRLEYNEDSQLIRLWAEKLTLSDGNVITNTEVWFNEDQSIFFLKAEDSFQYTLNDQNLNLIYLGLYPDNTPSRVITDGNITVSWNGQQITSFDNTIANFSPDGSLRSMRGYFWLDLSFKYNKLEDVLMKEIRLYPDGSLEKLKFRREQNVFFPRLGKLNTELICFAAGNIPDRLEFVVDSNADSKLELPGMGSFYLKGDGEAALNGEIITRLRYAHSPASIYLPGNRTLVIDENEHKAKLTFYPDGNLRSVNTTYKYYFDFKLDDEQVVKINNVEFWQNGHVKRILFSYPKQLTLPVVGSINCSHLKYHESGDLAQVDLAKGDQFRYEVAGEEMIFEGAILFHEGQKFSGARLSTDTILKLPDSTRIALEKDNITDLYPDGSLRKIYGTGQEFELLLPDGSTAKVPHSLDVEIEFFENGRVKRVRGLTDPHEFTFPNGAAATAYYMLEYDEQGNILSFY